MTAARIRRTGVSAMSPLVMLRGMKPSSAAFTYSDIGGACAALAKMLSTSPTRFGSGSTRWKHFRSSPFLCAMWSSASTTKSTGTRLIRPPSRPIAGIHGGRSWRMRWMSLKK